MSFIWSNHSDGPQRNSYHSLEGSMDLAPATSLASSAATHFSPVLLQSHWPFYCPMCMWICSSLRALVHAVSLIEMLFSQLPMWTAFSLASGLCSNYYERCLSRPLCLKSQYPPNFLILTYFSLWHILRITDTSNKYLLSSLALPY